MYSQIDSNKRRTWLLIIIFIGLISLLGYFLDYTMEYGNGILIIAIVISIIMSLFGYFSGDKVALVSSGAKIITKKQNPYLYRMVENLCIASGTPLPKIYVISDRNINAFATGRDPNHASIAVTTGAMERLENEELEGVIAHEISHIKNYDIRLMTVVIVLVGIVVLISDIFLRSSIFGFGGGKNRDSKNNGGVLAIVGIVLIVLSPLFAKLIQLAISRKREYLADASGALITRYPEGLANALEKIKLDKRPMVKTSSATAHLFIASPFGNVKSMKNIFSTHPPIDDRIKKLRNMM